MFPIDSLTRDFDEGMLASLTGSQDPLYGGKEHSAGCSPQVRRPGN